MASWTRHKPSLGLTCPPSERGEAHPCPFRGRLGCACWGTRGSGWIPQVENPGYAEISQTSSAGDVDFVSWFLFILGTEAEQAADNAERAFARLACSPSGRGQAG